MKFVASVLSVSLLALAGCDAVRLPGANAHDSSEPLEQPAEAAENPVLDENAPARTVVRIAASPSQETITDDDEAPASLAELNARRCADAPVSARTQTVSAQSGLATVEAPAFGTATLNSLAVTLATVPGIVKLEPRSISDTGLVTSSHCAAVRIAENWFVTAGHCVDGGIDELRLITGSETLSSPLALTVSADLAICHGAYSGKQDEAANDIALLEVSDAMLANMAQVPIAGFSKTARPLAPANYPVVNTAGWGLSGFGQGLSNELLGAQLALSKAGAAELTVSSRDGVGPCLADSGGPIYVIEADGTKKLVGILSIVPRNAEGDFCANDYVGQYVNLQSHTDWVADVIAHCSRSGACD